MQILAKRRPRLTSLFILSSFSILRAGTQYTANPGEQVAPGELIVAVKSGANIASLVPNGTLVGAKSTPLGHLNVYVVTDAKLDGERRGLAQNPGWSI